MRIYVLMAVLMMGCESRNPFMENWALTEYCEGSEECWESSSSSTGLSFYREDKHDLYYGSPILLGEWGAVDLGNEDLGEQPALDLTAFSWGTVTANDQWYSGYEGMSDDDWWLGFRVYLQTERDLVDLSCWIDGDWMDPFSWDYPCAESDEREWVMDVVCVPDPHTLFGPRKNEGMVCISPIPLDFSTFSDIDMDEAAPAPWDVEEEVNEFVVDGQVFEETTYTTAEQVIRRWKFRALD